MAKKRKRKSIVKSLDKLCAEVVKLRDNRQCQRCGSFPSVYGCHWSHIYGRSRYSIRWDLWNSLVFCCGCHRWSHSYPIDFQQWFEERFPVRYFSLNVLVDGKPRCQIVRPIPDSELLEKEAYLKAKLKDLAR